MRLDGVERKPQDPPGSIGSERALGRSTRQGTGLPRSCTTSVVAERSLRGVNRMVNGRIDVDFNDRLLYIVGRELKFCGI